MRGRLVCYQRPARCAGAAIEGGSEKIAKIVKPLAARLAIAIVGGNRNCTRLGLNKLPPEDLGCVFEVVMRETIFFCDVTKG